MLSSCANPECGAEFLYFRQGQLVPVPRRATSETGSNVELFWLCGKCASHLDLQVALDGGVNVVSRQTMAFSPVALTTPTIPAISGGSL